MGRFRFEKNVSTSTCECYVKETTTLVRTRPRGEPGGLDNGSVFARGNDPELA